MKKIQNELNSILLILLVYFIIFNHDIFNIQIFLLLNLPFFDVIPYIRQKKQN